MRTSLDMFDTSFCLGFQFKQVHTHDSHSRLYRQQCILLLSGLVNLTFSCRIPGCSSKVPGGAESSAASVSAVTGSMIGLSQCRWRRSPSHPQEARLCIRQGRRRRSLYIGCMEHASCPLLLLRTKPASTSGSSFPLLDAPTSHPSPCSS